jgi:hypothetical protein
MENDMNSNAYNIICLIPTFIDYFFPTGATNFVETGQLREFNNLIMFSPASLATGLKKSSDIYPELIKTSVNNLQRRALMLECLDEMDFESGQFFRVDFAMERVNFTQGLEIYQIKVGYYQLLKDRKMTKQKKKKSRMDSSNVSSQIGDEGKSTMHFKDFQSQNIKLSFI